MSPDLETIRRETLDALVEHLAEEHLSVGEFDRRVALARAGTDAPSIRAALSGLPGRGSAEGG